MKIQLDALQNMGPPYLCEPIEMPRVMQPMLGTCLLAQVQRKSPCVVPQAILHSENEPDDRGADLRRVGRHQQLLT